MSNKFFSEILIQEQGSPQTPASGMLALFANAQGLHLLNSANQVIGPLGASTTTPPPANMVTTDTAQTISSSKTFTVAPVVPDGAFAIGKINGLQSALDSKYSTANPPPTQPAPANMATLDTAQTFTGTKTFTGLITLPSSSVTLTNISATGTRDATTFLRGDGSWATVSGGSGGTNVVTSTNTTAHKMTVAPVASPPANPVAGDVWLVSDLDTPGAPSSSGTTDLSNYVTLDSAQSLTAVKTFTVAPVVPDSAFTIAKISATGTRDSSTMLRGDGTWGPVAAPPIPFSYAGALTVKAGVFKFPISVACIVESVQITAGTASAGASIIADVNKNGTTIFTTQANRPTLAAGAVLATAPAPAVTALAPGDFLTVDIDQIGSTTAGSDVMVVVRIRRT